MEDVRPFDTLYIVAQAVAAQQRALKHLRHCRIVSVTLKANGKRIYLPNSKPAYRATVLSGPAASMPYQRPEMLAVLHE